MRTDPLAVLNSIPSDKLIDVWLAPTTTWYDKTADKVGSSISFKLFTPNSSNKSTKALLTGANTVNGDGGELAGMLSKPQNLE